MFIWFLAAEFLAFWLFLLLLSPRYSCSNCLGSFKHSEEIRVQAHPYVPSKDVFISEFVSTLLANSIVPDFQKHPEASETVSYLIPKNYQYILVFIFAIQEINKNAELLPNTTLRFKIYDNFFNSFRSCAFTMNLLFVGQGNPVNYNCGQVDKLMAVVGGLTSPNSVQMNNIFNIYKIPQLSYGAFDPVLKDKRRFPSFYRMVPNEESQYAGILQLLKHFGWNWIGLIVADDESGETFLRTMRPKLLQSHICLAWTLVIPSVTAAQSYITAQEKLQPIQTALSLTETNVILVYGDSQSLEGLQLVLHSKEHHYMVPLERVWITTADWDLTALAIGRKFTTKSFNGTFLFQLHTNVVSGFQEFTENINPFRSNLYFIHLFWANVFLCSFPEVNYYLPNKGNCTGTEKLGSLPGTVFEMGLSGQSYTIYNAVYAIAHALHTMYLWASKQNVMFNGWKVQPWQVVPAQAALADYYMQICLMG